MTLDQLVELTQNSLDSSKLLPYSLGEDEIERIIRQEEQWFYENYYESVYLQNAILRRGTLSNNAEFIATGGITLPDCVVSVVDFREYKDSWTSHSNAGDFSADRLIASEVYLSPYHGDDLVMRAAYGGFENLSKQFVLRYIQYDYNRQTRILRILGRQEYTADVFMRTYNEIPKDKLYDMHYFQRMVEGRSMIKLGETLSVFNFNLGGGITVNGDVFISRGESIVEDIKTRIDEETTHDYFLEF